VGQPVGVAAHGNPRWINVVVGRTAAARDLDLPRVAAQDLGLDLPHLDLGLPRGLPQGLPQNLQGYATHAHQVDATLLGRRSALARTTASQGITQQDVRKMVAHGADPSILRSPRLRNQVCVAAVVAVADAKHRIVG
jgi:hypothetical protein